MNQLILAKPQRDTIDLEDDVVSFLTDLSEDYPNIHNWIQNVVMPGLFDGTRKLVVKRYNNKIVAVGIAKKDRLEKKICTIRVSKEFYGRGIGLRLFKELMSWLDTEMPHLTISEKKLPEFQRIFDHLGFKCTSVHMGRYRSGVAEYLFNERVNVLFE